MTSYKYRAMTAQGSIVVGMIDASSEENVAHQIRQLGQYPISVSTLTAWGRLLATPFSLFTPLQGRALSIATEELATLLTAGLELDKALTILVDLSESARLREPIKGALARIRDGSSFADALAEEPVFPRFYVNMVRAGELGGSLALTLRRLADYLTRAQNIRDTVTSALVYPVVLLCASGLAIAFILIFVLPQFEPLFAEAGKSLPLSTRILIGSGAILRNFWWALAAVFAGLFYWLHRNLQKPEFRKRWDGHALRLPLIGPLIIKFETGRMARTLGTLLANGVAVQNAFVITSDTLTNKVIVSAVERSAVNLREGMALADQLSQNSIFPKMMIDMVRVGEETGKLDEMLLRLADFYESQVKHATDRLLALLVPALTIFLGMIIAGIIASMLTAILSVNELAV